MAGTLVAFEGVDGAGKTTQLRRLAEVLRARGVDVVTTKEPTDGPIGRRIRDTARTGRLPASEELDLFLADRREHLDGLVGPALARGAVVLVDRYFYSTIAYQGARGLDPAELLARNLAFAPVPALVVLLELPPELGVARVRGRDGAENLFEKLDDLRRADAVFRSLRRPELARIDGAPDPDTVHAAILAAFDAIPPSPSPGPA
jgi:dTMP kinase